MKKTKGEVNGTANMPKGYTTISKKLSTRIVAVVMVMVIVILGSALYLMRYITETKSRLQRNQMHMQDRSRHGRMEYSRN